MSTATLVGPPEVIDLEIELLYRLDSLWQSADDPEIAVGDHVALRCWNRGDHEVSAAVFMRTMAGGLRPVSYDMHDLWPDLPSEFGTDPDHSIVFSESDVELVLVASHDGRLIEELLTSPSEEQNSVDEEVAVFGLQLRGRPSEVPISDTDLQGLLDLARAAELNIAAHALQALTLLQPPRLTRTNVSQLLRNQLRMPQLIHRPWLIAIAANLADSALRKHLRGIAADSTDPQRQAAIQALGEVGDPYGLEALKSYLERSKDERSQAARILAILLQDFNVEPLDKKDPAYDSAAFWTALAAAQRGSFSALQEHVTQADEIGFWRLIGDEANIFHAIREFRSPSNELRDYLQQRLDTHELAPTVEGFYQELLEQTDITALTDGSRTIPDDEAEKIRNQLYEIPRITQLESFRTDADGWVRVPDLSAAQKGVLLTELVNAAVVQHSPSVAAAMLDQLIDGWRNYLWFPHVAGLLSVFRQVEDKDFDSIAHSVELKIGWLLSRAPITRVLRAVNERIATGDYTDSDIRALVNAIITHWDHVPPPITAEVSRVPLMIQSIALAEDGPWRQTQAWLEEKTCNGRVWSATITLTIGVPSEGLSGRRPATVARDHASAGDFGELIVVPRAGGAVVTPSTANLRLLDEETARATFELTTKESSVQLQVAIYQQQPTMLLQELKGSIEFGEIRYEQ